MGWQAEQIGQIEDTTVRRFVHAIVHVRRFLPFYVTGAVFAVTMAVVPAIDGGSGIPASTAEPGGGAGPAAGVTRASGGGVAATGAAASRAGILAIAPAFADTFLDGLIDLPSAATTGGAVATAPSGGLADSRTGDLTVTPPDFDTPAEFPEAPKPPEPCKLEPPSPAPAVEPSRELTSGQDTAEAVVGQDLPVDAGQTVAPASQEALCNVPASPVPVPDVPLPATPVAADEGPAPFAWLLRFAFLR